MRKLNFSFKSLLLAAGLLVGSANAWATEVTMEVPTPKYFNDFSSTTGLTIVGNGEFITDADPAFGQVFHNDPANASAVRTNYLQLPTTVFKDFTTDGGKTAMTIGFWVNKKGEDNFFYTPLFAAYKVAPSNGNTLPMFVCETRGLIQLNCNGYCDFGINDETPGTTYNDGTPYVSTVWLDDGAWHYYTVVLTTTTAKVYVDGDLKNGWTVDGTSEGQVISGLFTGAATELTYVTLGGNQAWTWADPDPAFAFDDFAVYDEALSAEQIARIISEKGKAASTYSITYDFKSFVDTNETSSAFTPSTSSVTGYTTVYKPNEFSDELGGKLAFQFNSAGSTQWTLCNTESVKGLCMSNSTKDEHFSIVGLKAGDKFVVNVASGQVLFTTSNCTGPYKPYNSTTKLYEDVTTGTPATWGELQSGETYTVLKDAVVSLQAKKTTTVISSIVITPSQAETMTAPSISSVAADGGRNVTITSGASNMLSGVTTYYTTDGSTPSSSSIKYTGTFLQATTATVKAITISNSSAATASTVTEQEVNLDVVDEPVLSVTGTSGNSRIVTITCPTEDATIYYSETEKTNAEDGWSTYSTPVTTDVTTLYAYAGKGSTKSDVVNIATGAGTTINLLAASVAHTAANAYTISNDQSSLLGRPTATVHYQLDGGAEQTSTATSVIVPVSADGILTYWLTATGYGSTSEANTNVYVAVPMVIVTTIDLCTTGATEDNNWATHGETVSVSEDDSHTYYQYKDQNSNIVNDGKFAATFGYSTQDQTWRIQRNSGGTKNQSSAEHIAILDLQKDQVVRVMCDIAPTVNANATVLESNTFTDTYSFTASADGNVVLNIAKNTVLKKVYVEQDHIVATITSAGWATLYTAYPLDFSEVTGLEAYTATVSDNTVKLTKVDDVPANTGVVLKATEIISESETKDYNIPVIASSETDKGSLIGSTTATDAGAAPTGKAYYILTKSGSEVKFTPASGTIAANKAYLEYGWTGPLVKALSVVFADGEATGITAPEVAEKAEDGVLYNLNGQQVTADFKGIVIKNGKKYFNK